MILTLTLILVMFMEILKIYMKKLNILLILEIIMLSIISHEICFSSKNSYNLYIMLLLSIFMVVDSVFGISLMVFNSRNTSKMSHCMKI